MKISEALDGIDARQEVTDELTAKAKERLVGMEKEILAAEHVLKDLKNRRDEFLDADLEEELLSRWNDPCCVPRRG